MSGTPFSNVNNIHVHSMIPEDQKNITIIWINKIPQHILIKSMKAKAVFTS